MARAGKQIEGFRRNVFSLNSTLGTLTSAFGIGLGVGAVTSLFAEASREADALNASMRKLQATAKITGIQFDYLQSTSKATSNRFGLATATANDLTVEIAKLAQQAGTMDQLGAGLQAFLDIGAARGLSAAETLQRVGQVVVGIDAGFDNLFGQNRSVLLDKFAASIGTTAGKLTDAQKQLAVWTAAIDDGGKVVGEYDEYLKSAAGQAERLAAELDSAQAKLGELTTPARLAATKKLVDLLGIVLDGDAWKAGADALRSGLPLGAAIGIGVNVGRLPDAPPEVVVPPPAGTGGKPGPTPEEVAKAAKEAADALQKEISLLEEARKLGILTNEERLRSYEIEGRLRRELEEGNGTLEDRVRLMNQIAQLAADIKFDTSALDAELAQLGRDIEARLRNLEGGANPFAPSGESIHGGRILNPRSPFSMLGADRSAADSAFFGLSQAQVEANAKATQESTEAFNEIAQASREVFSVFGDLADVSGELGDVLRSIETIGGGVGRIKAAGDQDGILKVAGIASGIGSIAAGIIGFADSIMSSRERVREARRELLAAIDDWADALVPKTAFERAKEKAGEEFTAFAEGIVEQFRDRAGSRSYSLTDVFGEGIITDVEKLKEISAGKGPFAKAAEELLVLNETYGDYIKNIEKDKELKRAAIEEDLKVRELRATGLDDEADAARIALDNTQEVNALREQGFEAEADWLEEIHALEAEQRAERKAAADAALAAEKAMSIAAFDFEIAARQAALAGDDLAAMQIRGEAAIVEQLAAWQDLVDAGKMTEEQFDLLSDIISEELAQAVADFEAQVDDLRASLADELELMNLIQSGDDRGAALFRNKQEWDDFIQSAIDAGMSQEFIDSANDYFKREADAINKRFDKKAAEELINSMRARDAANSAVNDHIVRRVAGISETQALTLTDIGWSQLSVLQEIAVNTRGIRGSDGVDGFGRPISTGSTTIQNTGQQMHLHINVAGSVIGINEIVAATGEAMSLWLGAEATETATQAGSAFAE